MIPPILPDKPKRFRIERKTPAGEILIDEADTLDDALTAASCHSDNIPDTELQIKTPSGNIVLNGDEK